MNKEVKVQWLKALRSGEYEQGRKSLCRNGKYCCLGVLADTQGWLSIDGSIGRIGSPFLDEGGSTVCIPMPLLNEVGMNCSQHEILIALNDVANKSFEEIADWIEEHIF